MQHDPTQNELILLRTRYQNLSDARKQYRINVLKQQTVKSRRRCVLNKVGNIVHRIVNRTNHSIFPVEGARLYELLKENSELNIELTNLQSSTPHILFDYTSCIKSMTERPIVPSASDNDDKSDNQGK